MWRSIGFNDQEFFADQNVVAWFKLGITGTTSHLFLRVVWWLWCARNEAVIAKEDLSPHFIHREIWSLASLNCLCGHVNSNIASTSRTITWHTSKEAATILNVKGSNLVNLGPSVFGGLLRNEEGHWLHGFYGNIGVTSNLHAELMVLFHGLSPTWEKGVRNLICYSDSLYSLSDSESR